LKESLLENAQQRLVATQFGPRAAAYVESSVHAQGLDLDQIEAILTAPRANKVLDLGCGGGHVSLRAAPLVQQVTAYDLAEPMLAAVDRLAAERGLANLVTQQGVAESLPFGNASFDMIISRYSAHHWTDLGAALRETRRVLAPGGRAIFIDVIAPEKPVLDTYLQTLELLRDPSHVRDYSETEWLDALATAGLTPGTVTRRRLRLEFSSWIARINSPETHVAAIRSLQRVVAEDVRAYYEIEPDGSFSVDTATFEAAC
jgi:SAM-dependent methyltransferase